MTDFVKLTRRERQIMDAIYSKGEASVLEIQKALPNAPSTMAIRRMLSILDQKGHLKRRKEGREFFYSAKRGPAKAGSKALNHVLETFFEGSLEEALSVHLVNRKDKLSETERNKLIDLINNAEKEGR